MSRPSKTRYDIMVLPLLLWCCSVLAQNYSSNHDGPYSVDVGGGSGKESRAEVRRERFAINPVPTPSGCSKYENALVRRTHKFQRARYAQPTLA